MEVSSVELFSYVQLKTLKTHSSQALGLSHKVGRTFSQATHDVILTLGCRGVIFRPFCQTSSPWIPLRKRHWQVFYWMLLIIAELSFEACLSLRVGAFFKCPCLSVVYLHPGPEAQRCLYDVILPNDLLNKHTALSVSPSRTEFTLLRPSSTTRSF